MVKGFFFTVILCNNKTSKKQWYVHWAEIFALCSSDQPNETIHIPMDPILFWVVGDRDGVKDEEALGERDKFTILEVDGFRDTVKVTDRLWDAVEVTVRLREGEGERVGVRECVGDRVRVTDRVGVVDFVGDWVEVADFVGDDECVGDWVWVPEIPDKKQFRYSTLKAVCEKSLK
jgi:hypothetical protein